MGDPEDPRERVGLVEEVGVGEGVGVEEGVLLPLVVPVDVPVDVPVEDRVGWEEGDWPTLPALEMEAEGMDRPEPLMVGVGV